MHTKGCLESTHLPFRLCRPLLFKLPRLIQQAALVTDAPIPKDDWIRDLLLPWTSQNSVEEKTPSNATRVG